MANTNYPSAETPRSETRPSSSSSTLKVLVGVLAALFIGSWVYFLYAKSDYDTKVQDKTVETATAMSSRDSVQFLYNQSLTRLDSITGNNNNLNTQLSDRQGEITQLKNEINRIVSNKNATAADLRRAKSLIGELNGKIAGLEEEVARLTGENQELAAANTHLTSEKQVLETNLQTTTSEREELARTVDVASTFSASNIQITPVDERKSGKEKVTTTAKRVDKLVISFDVENRVARSGPADMYVIVTAPDGKVITDASGANMLTTRNDGDRQYTARNTTEYEQGTRKSISIPLRDQSFQTGDYKIEIYQNGFKIAEGVRSLKKGGIFG